MKRIAVVCALAAQTAFVEACMWTRLNDPEIAERANAIVPGGGKWSLRLQQEARP